MEVFFAGRTKAGAACPKSPKDELAVVSSGFKGSRQHLLVDTAGSFRSECLVWDELMISPF